MNDVEEQSNDNVTGPNAYASQGRNILKVKLKKHNADIFVRSHHRQYALQWTTLYRHNIWHDVILQQQCHIRNDSCHFEYESWDAQKLKHTRVLLWMESDTVCICVYVCVSVSLFIWFSFHICKPFKKIMVIQISKACCLCQMWLPGTPTQPSECAPNCWFVIHCAVVPLFLICFISFPFNLSYFEIFAQFLCFVSFPSYLCNKRQGSTQM